MESSFFGDNPSLSACLNPKDSLPELDWPSRDEAEKRGFQDRRREKSPLVVATFLNSNHNN